MIDPSMSIDFTSSLKRRDSFSDTLLNLQLSSPETRNSTEYIINHPEIFRRANDFSRFSRTTRKKSVYTRLISQFSTATSIRGGEGQTRNVSASVVPVYYGSRERGEAHRLAFISVFGSRRRSWLARDQARLLFRWRSLSFSLSLSRRKFRSLSSLPLP